MVRKILGAGVLIACAISAACSSSSDEAVTIGDDAGDNGDVADAGNGDIAIAASTGAFVIGEDTTFTGMGSSDLGAIALSHGVGTIQFQNESAAAFFFNATPVPAGTGDAGQFTGDRDFEIIAAQADRLIVAFITCTGTALTYVYYETTDGIASDGELEASGTCAILEQSTSESVTLPAVDLAPPTVVSGYSITGPNISFDGTQPGTASLNGSSYALYPFHTIDCSDCASTGWYELHSVLWDPVKKNACLGILYLSKDVARSVELAYTVCLPSVVDPLTNRQQAYAGSWTAE